MYMILDLFNSFRQFMDQGGPVLWAIAAVCLLMWILILDRLFYYFLKFQPEMKDSIDKWDAREDKSSALAHSIRDAEISRISDRIDVFLPVIKTFVAICPLMGLLGTVTGMIDVFNVMAVTGGGDAQEMAGGVSRATIPTMAGMVVALSGLFADTYLSRKAALGNEWFSSKLIIKHG